MRVVIATRFRASNNSLKELMIATPRLIAKTPYESATTSARPPSPVEPPSPLPTRSDSLGRLSTSMQRDSTSVTIRHKATLFMIPKDAACHGD
jgi:hypothetical protein